MLELVNGKEGGKKSQQVDELKLCVISDHIFYLMMCLIWVFIWRLS